MMKGPSANFMTKVKDLNSNRKPQYVPDGKILKKKIPIGNGKLPNGKEQAWL